MKGWWGAVMGMGDRCMVATVTVVACCLSLCVSILVVCWSLKHNKA